MQTRKQSIIESISNVAAGYFISLASMFIVFPLMGIHSNASQNIVISLYFTVLSILRSYILRRFFNRRNAR